MDLAPMFTELVALEQQVSARAKAADPDDEMRVYPWRPSGRPELPAIWNWIDDGSVEIPDIARVDDIIVVTATIAVRPSDLGETVDRLVRLTDHFRAVVDPALWSNQPLPTEVDGVLRGTAKRAKRIVTRSSVDDFDGVPVMCMDMLLRIELPHIIRQ